MQHCKILLVNPPSVTHAYGKTLLRAEPLESPAITLPQLAASFPDEYDLKFIDLDLYKDWRATLAEITRAFKPRYTGVTANTPTFPLALKCARIAKENARRTEVVIGGVHPSVYPGEPLEDKNVDYVVHGEGDVVFFDLVRSGDPTDIPGVAYRAENDVVVNPRPALIEDLDALPLPRYDLVELEKYKGTSVLATECPAGYIESSRGCLHKCSFCNKSVFKAKFRPKSPARMLREVEYMLSAGFKWIHFIDDGFGADVSRIDKFCDLIAESGIDFKWTALSGFAGDQWTDEIFRKLKLVGCRRVSFGVESANPDILRNVTKEVVPEQLERGIASARKAGLETFGFFIIGLPGETEKTVRETINFAIRVKLDLAKFAILVPNPGTPLFKDWDNKGYIKTRDWSKYLFHRADELVYDHPTMSAEQLDRAYHLAYRRFYLRPGFILRRIFSSLREGTFLKNLTLLFHTKW